MTILCFAFLLQIVSSSHGKRSFRLIPVDWHLDLGEFPRTFHCWFMSRLKQLQKSWHWNFNSDIIFYSWSPGFSDYDHARIKVSQYKCEWMELPIILKDSVCLQTARLPQRRQFNGATNNHYAQWDYVDSHDPMSTQISLTDSNDYYFCRRLLHASNTVMPVNNETLGAHVSVLVGKLPTDNNGRVQVVNIIVKGKAVLDIERCIEGVIMKYMPNTHTHTRLTRKQTHISQRLRITSRWRSWWCEIFT